MPGGTRKVTFVLVSNRQLLLCLDYKAHARRHLRQERVAALCRGELDINSSFLEKVPASFQKAYFIA